MKIMEAVQWAKMLIAARDTTKQLPSNCAYMIFEELMELAPFSIARFYA